MLKTANATLSAAPVSRRQGWYTVWVLLAAAIVSYLDRGIVNVLVVDLRRSLHLSEVEISLIQGLSFSLFFAVACIPLGTLVDRYNRRNIIIAGIAGWSLMTAACGLAQNFWQLFLARAGVGIGEACLIPAAYSMVSDMFAPERRGRPMSVLLIGMAIGAAAAAVIGGVLLNLMGNRFTVPVGMLGEVAVWRLAFAWVALPGLFCILLLLTVREPERTATVRRDDHDGSFLRFLVENWRVFLPLYLGIAMISVLSYGTANWAPTAVMRDYGYSAGDAGVAVGIVMIPSSVLGAGLGGLIGDRLVAGGRRYGRLRAWLGGTVPAIVGSLLIAIGGPVWLFLGGFLLVVMTSAAFGALSYVAIYDALPGEFHGRAAGVGTFLGSLLGLGGGTAAVAMLTQYVFRNDSLVNLSVASVAALSAVLSPALIMLQLHGYERLRVYLAASSGA